jgi:hypothetical protein
MRDDIPDSGIVNRPNRPDLTSTGQSGELSMRLLWKSLMPLGLVFEVMIILAVLTGLRVIRLPPRLHLKLHRIMALVGAIGGLLHGFLALYLNGFRF